MEKKELLFFNPVFKTMIWGGNKMRTLFGYDIPADNTGECWAISAHPNGDCIVSEGKYKGKSLSDLWENHHELFGNSKGDRFPLLLKVIDAKEDLSIQVHPDDEYAKVNENGSLGKTECWYILDVLPDSKLVIGHNAKTKEELCNMIDEKRFKELITEVPVNAGDFVQIDPGTVHAIKGGVMILETQQNSDVTYRVYDYDRMQNGKLRDLHLNQSKDVITVPAKAGAVVNTPSDPGAHKLVDCNYYSVIKLNVCENEDMSSLDRFMIVSVVDGNGTVSGDLIDAVKIAKGQHFIVPSDCGKLTFYGNMTIICSYSKS